jgi:hypothetical protein
MVRTVADGRGGRLHGAPAGLECSQPPPWGGVPESSPDREIASMKRRLLWSLAVIGALGCGSSGVNPNEANFPGAAGSSVPLPPGAPEKSKGGGSPMGGPGSLPAGYPGMSKMAGKGATDETKEPAKDAEPKADEAAAKAEEKAAEEPRPDAGAAPEAPKAEEKAAEPKAEEATPKDEPGPAEPKAP